MWTEDNTQDQLIAGILRHGPNILEHCQTSSDITKYLERIDQERLDYPVPHPIDPSDWFIPRKYQEMDIESWLLDNSPKENHERILSAELQMLTSHSQER
jgi:hypothetical protein